MIKKILLLVLLTFIVFEFQTNLLHLTEIINNSIFEGLSKRQIDKYLEKQNKINWIKYFIVPIFILLKTVIISSIVYTGTFFFSKKQVFFKQILSIVLKAEFIFLLVPVFKTVWFYFFQTSYKLEDIQYFYPLSAINITGYQGLEQWLIYPFQFLNLFELAYIIYLGYELGKLTETTHDNGLKIMAYSYVPMMLLWVTVVMFFTLNYTS